MTPLGTLPRRMEGFPPYYERFCIYSPPCYLNGGTDRRADRQMFPDLHKRDEMAEFKEQIKEIVEIVQLVPEQFKTMCFEMLLKEAIASNRPATVHSPSAPVAPQPKSSVKDPIPQALEKIDEALSVPPSSQPKVGEGTDIVTGDIHMKVRKFLEKGDLTVSNLNELFYKNNGGFESLITDLGVTKMSEAQMRVSLFQALHNALATGEFVTSVEKVREECKMRKSYADQNFGANFKNNASLFDFGTWTKDVTELKLSEEGKKSLAIIIKTLS